MCVTALIASRKTVLADAASNRSARKFQTRPLNACRDRFQGDTVQSCLLWRHPDCHLGFTGTFNFHLADGGQGQHPVAGDLGKRMQFLPGFEAVKTEFHRFADVAQAHDGGRFHINR